MSAVGINTRDFVDGNVPSSVASDVIRLSQKLNAWRAAYISANKRIGITTHRHTAVVVFDGIRILYCKVTIIQLLYIYKSYRYV